MIHDLLSLSLFVPEMKACGSRRIEFWDGTGFGLHQVYLLEAYKRVMPGLRVK